MSAEYGREFGKRKIWEETKSETDDCIKEVARISASM